MPTRFCIIGGGGYFGQHIAAELQKQGHHTVLLDLRFINVPLIQLNEELTTRYTGSLLDTELLNRALKNAESCFHVAAHGVRGGASLDKNMTYKVNVEGTKVIIKCCKLQGVKRLIFSSSVSVIFHSEEIFDADENTPYPPLSKLYSPYSASKLIAEQYVLKSNCDDFRTSALRLRGIYGPGEPNMVQQCIDLLQKGLFSVTFEKSSNCITQYSNIYNCVSAMLLADEALRAGRACGQVYHIVDEGTVGSLAFWKPLITATGSRYPKVRIPYIIMFYMAYLLEILYRLFGIEPIFTRLEINLMALSNTYSIEKAKKDLGYAPSDNNDITKAANYYRSTALTVQKKQLWKLYLFVGSSSFIALSSFFVFLWMFITWF